MGQSIRAATSRREGTVRIWQPGRLLAADASLPGTRPADDDLRLRLAMERNPEASAAIAKSGFDVCSHGWRWIKHYELDEATEREHIRKAIAAIRKMTGERPLGWYCRYGPGVNTRRLVVEEGGFLYDSDYYGEELPFWVHRRRQAAARRALLRHQQ
jgi:hypothetical protein